VARCAGQKPDGSPCERIVRASQSYCFAHDPARAEERKRNAARARRARPNREIVGLKVQLQDIADGVLSGALEPKRGAVGVQALSALIRALEQERRQREFEELEARISELERRREWAS
jgi:hypothetical protein